jgi:hypothetical protein
MGNKTPCASAPIAGPCREEQRPCPRRITGMATLRGRRRRPAPGSSPGPRTRWPRRAPLPACGVRRLSRTAPGRFVSAVSQARVMRALQTFSRLPSPRDVCRTDPRAPGPRARADRRWHPHHQRRGLPSARRAAPGDAAPAPRRDADPIGPRRGVGPVLPPWLPPPHTRRVVTHVRAHPRHPRLLGRARR